MTTEDRSDLVVLRDVLATVGGRPALAPIHAAASALLAELDTAGADDPSVVPPGDVPDVDVPRTTRPRIDQPLGDPSPGSPAGDPPLGILDAELLDDSALDGSIGGGLGASSVGGGLGAGSVTSPAHGFTEAGVPTWDSVRDSVESRSATASGREELDRESSSGRTLEEQWNDRAAAGRSKLDEIRRSMGDRNPG